MGSENKVIHQTGPSIKIKALWTITCGLWLFWLNNTICLKYFQSRRRKWNVRKIEKEKTPGPYKKEIPSWQWALCSLLSASTNTSSHLFSVLTSLAPRCSVFGLAEMNQTPGTLAHVALTVPLQKYWSVYLTVAVSSQDYSEKETNNSISG